MIGQGSIYLVALEPQEDKIKHYKLDRIEAVERSHFPFRRPEGFHLAAHLASSFGVFQCDGEPTTVRVRFAPPVARYIQESKWHASQRLARQRDGSLLAEFRLSSTVEIKRWILSFGSQVIVLEPEGLRREIAEELEALAASYASAPTPAARAAPHGAGHAGAAERPLIHHRG